MTPRAIVVLVERADDAEAVRTVIGAAMAGADDPEVLIAPKGLRGTGLWTDEDAGAPWWERHHLGDREVAVLVQDRPGLEHELRDLQSRWLVWCHDAGRVSAYAGARHVTALGADDAATFAAGVLAALASPGWHPPARLNWGPFRREVIPSSTHVVAAPAVQPDMPNLALPAAVDEELDRGQLPPMEPEPTGDGHGPAPAPAPALSETPPLPTLEWGTSPRIAPQSPPAPPATPAATPIESVAVSDTTGPPRPSRTSVQPPRSPRRSLRQRLTASIGARDRTRDADVDMVELAQTLTALHDTVVYVGSRKGGVGKTTESLALGFLAAQAVEALGGSTVVIEANVTNADIAVKLRLPETAPTVRDLVRGLMNNFPAPAPVAARGSALRVYGEHRETERYTAPEIAVLAVHLRAFYTLAVVDGPNAIPGLDGKAESVVEAWLPHADVVVIPLDTSTASFEGAADMLAAISDIEELSNGAYSPGVVVAFLAPQDLVARKVAPDLAATLAELEAAGARIVDIPLSSWMGMIEWSDHPVPLTDADPAVTRAYWRLLAAVIAARRVPAHSVAR